MKKLMMLIIMLTMVVACGTEGETRDDSPKGFGNGNGSGSGQNSADHEEKDPVDIVNSYEKFELSDQVKDDLIFMWEEEKLARDVYIHFIVTWNHKVFINISKAEQKHMESIGALLDKYELERPSNPEENGVFTNQKLQDLYNDLVVKGDNSLNEAFKVGKDIEIIDIADLKRSIEVATVDAVEIYKGLLEASEKHLTAFTRQLLE